MKTIQMLQVKVPCINLRKVLFRGSRLINVKESELTTIVDFELLRYFLLLSMSPYFVNW